LTVLLQPQFKVFAGQIEMRVTGDSMARPLNNLDGFDVDPETKRVLGVALEKTRVALGHKDNFANGIIAKRIIEIAEAGERNPDLLCEGALNKLREHLYGD
jgi:hypothetical protein